MEPCNDFTSNEKLPKSPACSPRLPCESCFYVKECAAGRILKQRDALDDKLIDIKAAWRNLAKRIVEGFGFCEVNEGLYSRVWRNPTHDEDDLLMAMYDEARALLAEMEAE